MLIINFVLFDIVRCIKNVQSFIDKYFNKGRNTLCFIVLLKSVLTKFIITNRPYIFMRTHIFLYLIQNDKLMFCNASILNIIKICYYT